MPALAGIPTVIVAGDKDRLTPLDRSQAIADVLPDAEFVIAEGSGHMAMMEDPTLTNDALRRMLQPAVRLCGESSAKPPTGIARSQGPPRDQTGHRRGRPSTSGVRSDNAPGRRSRHPRWFAGSREDDADQGHRGRDGGHRAGDVTDVRHRQGAPARPPVPAAAVPLVHVDAYRLSGALELDDLDLDTDLDAAAVVIEWGEGVAERLVRATG